MQYSRTHVRQALSAAREAGRDVSGMPPERRETAVILERWGYLPINQEQVDERIAAWYVANGLATRADDTPGDTPEVPAASAASVIRVGSSASSTMAALVAAEAAIEAARLALAAARTMGGSAA